MARQRTIARAIAHAILHEERHPGCLGQISQFFHLYWLDYTCLEPELFRALKGFWALEIPTYRASFSASSSKDALLGLGDMGFSGSTFFTTPDGRYLIKSVPRRFEHAFFRDELLLRYAEHMSAHPASLLVRITDFLQNSHATLGSLAGLAPSHHIVMENIRHGEEADVSEWETWDLKPMDYFYPERDIAGGALTSEATKKKLADDFPEKILLTQAQASHLKQQLEIDTQLLARANAVDYSLMLVRIPRSEGDDVSEDENDWRAGVRTADGKHVYRAVLLDFFWAKHATQAKVMTGLVNGYRLVDDQGPMSVTTDAPEYRERFLEMCREIVEVQTQTL